MRHKNRENLKTYLNVHLNLPSIYVSSIYLSIIYLSVYLYIALIVSQTKSRNEQEIWIMNLDYDALWLHLKSKHTMESSPSSIENVLWPEAYWVLPSGCLATPGKLPPLTTHSPDRGVHGVSAQFTFHCPIHDQDVHGVSAQLNSLPRSSHHLEALLFSYLVEMWFWAGFLET